MPQRKGTCHRVRADIDVLLLLVKRVRCARAGIVHYWIIRLAQDDGPAVSVELLRPTSDGSYALEQVTFRKKEILAIDVIDPVEVTVT